MNEPEMTPTVEPPKPNHQISPETFNRICYILAAIFSVLFVILIVIATTKDSGEWEAPQPEGTEPAIESEEDELSRPSSMELQSTVDAWLKTLNKNVEVGLMIYDLDREEIAAAYRPNQAMNIASIYKLFYVYAGYRQIELGGMDGDKFFVKTDDYRAGNYTFSECLDLMIRESYNGCADVVRGNRIQSARAEALMRELNLKNTTNLGLSSTAADLTKLMILYWQHPDLSEKTWNKIADSMLNQPPTKISESTTYDWRQGLPAGFSSEVKVYDKVGWEWGDGRWNIYADAALLDFTKVNRHFSIVVITRNLPGATPKAMQDLGRRLESAVASRD